MRRTALVLLVLQGCNMPTTSTVLPEMVLEQFKHAQEQVARQYPDVGDPYTIEPLNFRWVEMAGLFECGDFKGVEGCFTANKRLVQYKAGSKGAVWHESGHAILYALGDTRWRCSFSGHEGNPICAH